MRLKKLNPGNTLTAIELKNDLTDQEIPLAVKIRNEYRTVSSFGIKTLKNGTKVYIIKKM